MMLNTWQRQEKLKRRFTLPNELFSLGLNANGISVYSQVHIHLHLWRLNSSLKTVYQLVHDALSRIDRCHHELIRVNGGQIQLKPDVLYPLREENSLCAAVPFPEGVKHIDGVIKIGHFLYQFMMAQALGLKFL